MGVDAIMWITLSRDISAKDVREAGTRCVVALGWQGVLVQAADGDGDYAHELGTTGVPESFLVGPAGKLAAHRPGPFRDEGDIAAFAAPALEGG